MLISNDRRTVIVTPVRTGTESLTQLLLTNGFEHINPKHGYNIPFDVRNARVILPIRNPYARLASMYHYGLTKYGSDLSKAPLLHRNRTFVDFVREWSYEYDNGRDIQWLWTYSTYAKELLLQRPAAPHLVSIDKDGLSTAVYLATHRNDLLVPRINTTIHSNVPLTQLWTPECMTAIGNRLLPDMRLGGYHGITN